MANATRNRTPEPKVRGATGDTRNVTSNVGGTKSDRQMDTASHRGTGTTTGSKAGDKILARKLAASRPRRPA